MQTSGRSTSLSFWPFLVCCRRTRIECLAASEWVGQLVTTHPACRHSAWTHWATSGFGARLAGRRLQCVRACRVRDKNKVTFLRSFARKFITIFLADTAHCFELLQTVAPELRACAPSCALELRVGRLTDSKTDWDKHGQPIGAFYVAKKGPKGEGNLWQSCQFARDWLWPPDGPQLAPLGKWQSRVGASREEREKRDKQGREQAGRQTQEEEEEVVVGQ